MTDSTGDEPADPAFSRGDLAGVDLAGGDLAGVDASGDDLPSGDLSGAFGDDPDGDVQSAAAEADRLEQWTAAAAVADAVPTPLPERILDMANPADAAEQAIEVPVDEDEYR